MIMLSFFMSENLVVLVVLGGDNVPPPLVATALYLFFSNDANFDIVQMFIFIEEFHTT